MGDKVIQFPGAAGRQPPEEPQGGKPGRRRSTERGADKPDKADKAKTGLPGGQRQDLTEEQEKAVQIVLSGMPFVMIGVKPTQSGADFFTAVHGDADALRNAAPHLAGVIERAFGRKGI